MAEKVTVMVLKVDLQCPCCYKKVKKILCKFPQIRDQMYNEKANTVTITVVCCDPEKLRDKLCCKGCKVIKSIEIVEPPKPKPPSPKPKEKEKHTPKPPPPNPPPPPPPNPPPPPAPSPAPPPNPPPPEPCRVPVRTCCGPCSEGHGGGPCYHGYGGPPPRKGPPPPEPCQVPVRTCCGPCSEGRGGGPCYHGYGVPPPPQPCYDGYYGYGHGGYDRPCHVSRCDYYLSEENPHACSIM